MNDPTDFGPTKTRRKVSAFASAFQSAVITAEISFSDVLKVKPGMSREQAEAFLHIHADLIGEEMLRAGVLALIAYLEGGRDAQ